MNTKPDGHLTDSGRTRTDSPPVQTEAQFQRQVRDCMELCGWDLIWCTWNSQHSPAGEPDIRALREKDNRAIWIELKRGERELKNLTEDQYIALETLQRMGRESYLWTPEDWPEIKEVLR